MTNVYYAKLPENSSKTLSEFAWDLLKKQLTKTLNTNEHSLKFAKTKNGKPYLVNVKDYYFNISHSGHYIAFAISNKPVGIDVQKIRDVDLKIAKRFYSKDEYQSLINLKYEKEQKNYFFELWVLKESYIKFTGKGLKQGLNSFNIIKTGNEYTLANQKDTYLQLLDFDNDYKLAVCGSLCLNPIHLKQVDNTPKMAYNFGVCSEDL